MNRKIALGGAVAAVALASVVAACGGYSSTSATTPASTASTAQGSTQATAQTTSAPAGGTTLQLAADPSGALRFDKSSLTAPAGKVTIDLVNASSVGHDVAISGNGVNAVGKVVQGGGTSTVTADLKPGTYTFYCSVAGHRAAGMQGTLTVR